MQINNKLTRQKLYNYFYTYTLNKIPKQKKHSLKNKHKLNIFRLKIRLNTWLLLICIISLLLIYIITNLSLTSKTKTQANSPKDSVITNLFTWSLNYPLEKLTLFNPCNLHALNITSTDKTNLIPSNNTQNCSDTKTTNALDNMHSTAQTTISKNKIIKQIQTILNKKNLHIKLTPSNVHVVKTQIDYGLNNQVLQTSESNTKNPQTQQFTNTYFNTLNTLHLGKENAWEQLTTKFPFIGIKIQTKIKLPAPIIKHTTEDLPPGKQVIAKQGSPGIAVIEMSTILHLVHNLKTNTTTQYKTLSFKKPIPYIVKIGAPPKYRTIKIDNKTIRYYRTMNVWATSYDSNCAGCNNTTATGRRLTYGIIAVDPRIIPLHTCIYVPGYGFGQAEDTGGAIKGNKIDLAFEDVHYGWWSARYVDIYLVDCKDAKLPWNK